MSNEDSRHDAADGDEPGRDRPRSEVPRGERAVPEFMKRILEAGLEKLSEQPDQLRQKLADLKLPKETLSALLAQLDDSKSGLYRIVSKELREFLENTNFAEDLVRALTKLSFEIKTEIRFIPNETAQSASSRGAASGSPTSVRPHVKASARVKTDSPEKENEE